MVALTRPARWLHRRYKRLKLLDGGWATELNPMNGERYMKKLGKADVQAIEKEINDAASARHSGIIRAARLAASEAAEALEAAEQDVVSTYARKGELADDRAQKLKSAKGGEVFYTTDGSDPDPEAEVRICEKAPARRPLFWRRRGVTKFRIVSVHPGMAPSKVQEVVIEIVPAPLFTKQPIFLFVPPRGKYIGMVKLSKGVEGQMRNQVRRAFAIERAPRS